MRSSAVGTTRTGGITYCLISITLLTFYKFCLIHAMNELGVNTLRQAQQQLPVDALTATELSSSSIHDDTNFEQRVNEKLQAEQHQEHELLSRKRRYLLFPAGSSFQLVYHVLFGIISYTNFLILHITNAFAYALPSDPPSEMLEDIRQKLADGDLDVSRVGNVTNVKYVDTKTNKPNPKPAPNYNYNTEPMFRPPMHGSFYDVSDSYYRRQPPARRKDSYYYKNKYSKPSNPFNDYNNYSEKGTKYPWWQLQSRLSNSLRPMVQQQDSYYRQQTSSTTTTTTTTERPIYVPRVHKIIPVFAKRSIRKRGQRQRRSEEVKPEPELSKYDRIHYREHRNTRHKLYEKIEKYLETHEQHGEHCVLRALCETGQKSHENEPGTFIGELLRAVFTLPEPMEDDHHGTTHYDRANGHEGDCAAKYHLCKHSMWEANFVK